MGKGNCGHCGKELKYCSGVAEVMLDPKSKTRISSGQKTLCGECSNTLYEYITFAERNDARPIMADEVMIEGDPV